LNLAGDPDLPHQIAGTIQDRVARKRLKLVFGRALQAIGPELGKLPARVVEDQPGEGK
jgi:hypothetical protein